MRRQLGSSEGGLASSAMCTFWLRLLERRARLIGEVVFLVVKRDPGCRWCGGRRPDTAPYSPPPPLWSNSRIGFRPASAAEAARAIRSAAASRLGLEGRQVRADIGHLTEISYTDSSVHGFIGQRAASAGTRLRIASARPRGAGRCKG